ncbi:MAG: DUF881 domain-containing protein [Candidatus Limnocylindrales bacterium]
MAALVARVRRVPSWQVTLAAAMLVLGFLMVAQAGAEPSVVQYTSQERPPLVETATELQSQQDGLKAQILQLRAQIEDLEASSVGNNALVTSLNQQLQRARLAAGLVDLQGPGVVVQLEDSTEAIPPGAAPGDYLVGSSDLLAVVNELWLDGAEAIAVNGERITATSGMTDIGSSILLNGTYLQPPYQIVAIGPNDLYARLTSSANFERFLKARVEGYGIGLGAGSLDKAVVPAYAGTVALAYARALPPGQTPAPTSAGSGP